MSRYAILLAGDVTPTPRLHRQLQGRRIIAADSGMAHAAPLSLTPELWVGDFDSADPALEITYAQTPRKTFARAKNATDGAIAISEALARGATSVLLVGATGGQFDHVLSHAAQLLALDDQGVEAFGSNGLEEIYPLTNRLQLADLLPGTRLSIVGLELLQGLSLSGVRWALHNHDVKFGETLTLSNEIIGDVDIVVQGGRALVMIYPYTEQKP